MTTFLIAFLIIAGAVALAVGAALAGALVAIRDHKLETERERARLHNAYHTGDLMCAELAGMLARKDLGAKTRCVIGDLMFRWGALRPVSTSKVTVEELEPEYVGAVAPETV